MNSVRGGAAVPLHSAMRGESGEGQANSSATAPVSSGSPLGRSASSDSGRVPRAHLIANGVAMIGRDALQRGESSRFSLVRLGAAQIAARVGATDAAEPVRYDHVRKQLIGVFGCAHHICKTLGELPARDGLKSVELDEGRRGDLEKAVSRLAKAGATIDDDLARVSIFELRDAGNEVMVQMNRLKDETYRLYCNACAKLASDDQIVLAALGAHQAVQKASVATGSRIKAANATSAAVGATHAVAGAVVGASGRALDLLRGQARDPDRQQGGVPRRGFAGRWL